MRSHLKLEALVTPWPVWASGMQIWDHCLHREQEIQQDPREKDTGRGRQDWRVTLPVAVRLRLRVELMELRVRVLQVFFLGGCFPALFYQGKVGRGGVQGKG